VFANQTLTTVPADVVDYLDRHAGAFSALLTLALVAVTIFYAIQNRRMVGEMANANAMTILPKLAIDFHRIGPNTVEVLIQNLGLGPALDVDVSLSFDPLADRPLPADNRRYRRNVIAPGERERFLPPGDLNANMDRLPREYAAIRLGGSMRDAAGNEHVVAEVFDRLVEWRELLHDATVAWIQPDAEKRLADALADKTVKPLIKELTALGAAVSALSKRDEGT
jgi:hypothetical protein